MKEFIASVQNVLNSNDIMLGDRPAATAFLVGEAVGNSLSLPTSPVDNPKVYFLTTHKATLNQVLSAFNEECVLDLDEVESVVFKIWQTRYRLVHLPGSEVSRGVLHTLISQGCPEIPKAYTDLSNKYRFLYTDRWLLASANECVGTGA